MNFACKKAIVITELEKDILPLQGLKKLSTDNNLNIDCGIIEHSFPNASFPIGCMHEFLSSTQQDNAATMGFIAALLYKLAGIEPKNVPMQETQGEKGIDVYMAVETLQVGLDDKIDMAVLITGDREFVPRALMKNGIRVLIAYFEYEEPKNKSFCNERLINAANYAININSLENDREFKADFKTNI